MAKKIVKKEKKTVEELPPKITPPENKEEEKITPPTPAPVVEAEESDYLQKYQYKKVNNIPTIGGPLTNPDSGSKAEKMKRSLLTQRRVSTMIPLDQGTDPKIPFSVTLNGYRLDLPTSTYIELPEQVAEIIRNSNNQTVAALAQNRISGNSAKEAALG